MSLFHNQIIFLILKLFTESILIISFIILAHVTYYSIDGLAIDLYY